jgi:hypothetical protein
MYLFTILKLIFSKAVFVGYSVIYKQFYNQLICHKFCHFIIKIRLKDEFGACNSIIFFFISNSGVKVCSHERLHAHIYILRSTIHTY